jgi:hypothetical protein
MFELVKALNDGAETLKNQTSNSISLNAGCELFIAFVTLFPHDSAVCPFLDILHHIFISFFQNFTDLKKELIRHGQTYATEALTYRKKIAELAFGFIKDGSVVSYVHLTIQSFNLNNSPGITFTDTHTFLFTSCDANPLACSQTETHIRYVITIPVEIYKYIFTFFPSFCHRSTPSRFGVCDVIVNVFLA